MPNNPDIPFLNNQLEQQRENLRQLRGQQDIHAKGEERLSLLNQIMAVEKAIRETKAKLRQLGEQPAASAIDPSEVFQPFADHFIKQYPQPIAQACANFNQEQELGRKFTALDRLIIHFIKYLAAIFIGQARRDKPTEYPLPESLDWMATPTIEIWTDALAQLSQIYQQSPQRETWQLTGLLDACTRPLLGRKELLEAIDYLTLQSNQSGIDEPSVVDFLQLLAWYCRKEWEDAAAHYPLEQIEPLLQRLQPALSILLNEMESLRQYPLIYVEWAQPTDSEIHLRPKKFMGQFVEEMAPAPKPALTVPAETAFSLKPKRLYLADKRGVPLIPLHPFFVVYESELYHLKSQSSINFVEFRSCSRGKTFRPPPESSTFFESWTQGEVEETPPEEVPPLLGDEEAWQLKVEPIPSNMAGEPIPLTWLNPEGREALEIALGEALRIGRFWLGVEFLLMGLSKQREGIFLKLLSEIGLHPGEFRGVMRGMVGVVAERDWRQQNVGRLGAEALAKVRVADPDRLRQSLAKGDEPPSVITPRGLDILQQAAKFAGEGQVGHTHLLVAAFRQHRSFPIQLFFSIAYQAEWSPQQVLTRLADLAGANPQDLVEDKDTPDFPADLPPPPDRSGRTPLRPSRGGSIVTEFGRDLTQAAQAGQLHPAEGESARRAMAQMGRILLQREANNPILVGDPGVGKTALVEGFAYRLAGGGKGAVKQLAGRRVIELSANTLTAGTKYRGQLEERLQQLLAEVKKAKGQIILFIDEIHSLLEGGSTGGLADALKPALSRGEFPCIGATTMAEYRQHIEKDAALARRFTPVWLEEPSLEEAIEVVGKVATGHLAEYHNTTFAPEAIEAAVRLSARYLHEERLPGKAIKLLDQAASGLIIGGSLSGEADDDQSMVLGGMVTVDDILEIVADRTNIPLTQLGKTDKERLLELDGKLRARLIGQDEAVSRVVRVVKRAGAGLSDPRRPQGVFLFAGPTGVGKTELALALTEALFDNEEAIFRLDMSEFMEKHQVARLIGAPPGYVGYETEGQLTGHLRRRPYSVVLLDEIEKAHEDVQHLFLQLFDNGRLTDAQGRLADGRNAIFIMTTNLGAKEAIGLASVTKSYQDKLLAAIYDHFTPEFINRIDRIILFDPLDEAALLQIFDRELNPFQERLRSEKRITVEVANPIKQQVVAQVVTQKMGARPLRRLIEDQIISPVIDKLLTGEYQPGTQVTIGQAAALDIQPPPPSPPFAPPVELAGLGEMGRPAPPRSPQRPASPEAGLPHNERLPEEAQAEFDQHYLTLARRLADQDIALEIDGLAKFFMCSPTAADQKPREGRSIKQAFDDLIEQPLTDMLLDGEIKTGDWIKIDYSPDGPVIKKMGDDAR